MQYQYEELQSKWQPIIEHADLPEISDSHKKSVTAVCLENTEKSLKEEQGFGPASLLEAAPTNATGSNVDNYDPVLISLVRRAMPNLVAYDLVGVQPMTGPTGLIFAMRSRYTNQTGTEAFYNEANTEHSTVVAGSGNNTLGQSQDGTQPSGNSTSYNFAEGMSIAQAEALGSSGNTAFAEMAFSIEKIAVTAKSRALKAEYSMELAQDLKAIHGLDAETELANILSTEILAEINREIVRTVNLVAVTGAQQNTSSAGTFDLDIDSNGRWMVEKFKGLMFQIEREANEIARGTRRGKGNIMLCSSDVASALQMAGVLDYTPALNSNNLAVDDTGNTFAGVLNGRLKVYIDPYSTVDFACVGYRGSNPYDAGMFYCPYVPLTMVKAVGESDFQPRIGFKTRYGMVTNPFVAADGVGTDRANPYFRIFRVDDIMV
jgi:hypothetical protein